LYDRIGDLVRAGDRGQVGEPDPLAGDGCPLGRTLEPVGPCASYPLEERGDLAGHQIILPTPMVSTQWLDACGIDLQAIVVSG
jgi:hypothetical protein